MPFHVQLILQPQFSLIITADTSQEITSLLDKLVGKEKPDEQTLVKLDLENNCFTLSLDYLHSLKQKPGYFPLLAQMADFLTAAIMQDKDLNEDFSIDKAKEFLQKLRTVEIELKKQSSEEENFWNIKNLLSATIEAFHARFHQEIKHLSLEQFIEVFNLAQFDSDNSQEDKSKNTTKKLIRDKVLDERHGNPLLVQAIMRNVKNNSMIQLKTSLQKVKSFGLSDEDFIKVIGLAVQIFLVPRLNKIQAIGEIFIIKEKLEAELQDLLEPENEKALHKAVNLAARQAAQTIMKRETTGNFHAVLTHHLSTKAITENPLIRKGQASISRALRNAYKMFHSFGDKDVFGSMNLFVQHFLPLLTFANTDDQAVEQTNIDLAELVNFCIEDVQLQNDTHPFKLFKDFWIRCHEDWATYAYDALMEKMENFLLAYNFTCSVSEIDISTLSEVLKYVSLKTKTRELLAKKILPSVLQSHIYQSIDTMEEVQEFYKQLRELKNTLLSQKSNDYKGCNLYHLNDIESELSRLFEKYFRVESASQTNITTLKKLYLDFENLGIDKNILQNKFSALAKNFLSNHLGIRLTASNPSPSNSEKLIKVRIRAIAHPYDSKNFIDALMLMGLSREEIAAANTTAASTPNNTMNVIGAVEKLNLQTVDTIIPRLDFQDQGLIPQ